MDEFVSWAGPIGGSAPLSGLAPQLCMFAICALIACTGGCAVAVCYHGCPFHGCMTHGWWRLVSIQPCHCCRTCSWTKSTAPANRSKQQAILIQRSNKLSFSHFNPLLQDVFMDAINRRVAMQNLFSFAKVGGDRFIVWFGCCIVYCSPSPRWVGTALLFVWAALLFVLNSWFRPKARRLLCIRLPRTMFAGSAAKHGCCNLWRCAPCQQLLSCSVGGLPSQQSTDCSSARRLAATCQPPLRTATCPANHHFVPPRACATCQPPLRTATCLQDNNELQFIFLTPQARCALCCVCLLACAELHVLPCTLIRLAVMAEAPPGNTAALRSANHRHDRALLSCRTFRRWRMRARRARRRARPSQTALCAWCRCGRPAQTPPAREGPALEPEALCAAGYRPNHSCCSVSPGGRWRAAAFYLVSSVPVSFPSVPFVLVTSDLPASALPLLPFNSDCGLTLISASLHSDSHVRPPVTTLRPTDQHARRPVLTTGTLRWPFLQSCLHRVTAASTVVQWTSNTVKLGMVQWKGMPAGQPVQVRLPPLLVDVLTRPGYHSSLKG